MPSSYEGSIFFLDVFMPLFLLLIIADGFDAIITIFHATAYAFFAISDFFGFSLLLSPLFSSSFAKHGAFRFLFLIRFLFAKHYCFIRYAKRHLAMMKAMIFCIFQTCCCCYIDVLIAY